MIEITFTSGRESLQIEAETMKEAVEKAVKDKKILIFADLHGANLHGADLYGADLYGADLSGADLIGADLHGANLHGANLSGADLRRANLSGADLIGASLHGADLHGADLHGADLHGADLRRANIIGADLDYSCWPLWCGSFDVKIDKRIFCQLLYHTLRAGQSVEDEEVQALLNNPDVLALANQFHLVDECGRIGETIKHTVKR